MNEELKNRLERERVERTTMKELQEMAQKSTMRNAARPTNPRRYEEAKRNYTELKAPEISKKEKSQSAPTPSGTSVKFYVYYDGVIGTIAMSTQGSFTPL